MSKIKQSKQKICGVNGNMATRESVEQFIQQCEDALRNAHAQYTEAKQLEHYNDTEFTSAQEQIEATYNDLMHLSQSCNAQQREQLNRMRLQLQNLQNEMTLLRH
ncbi:YtzC family protein [Sutcliffiella horikoshii]